MLQRALSTNSTAPASVLSPQHPAQLTLSEVEQRTQLLIAMRSISWKSRRATSATGASGADASRTIRGFSSTDYRRRRSSPIKTPP